MDPQLAVLGYARLCLDVLTSKLPKMDFKYSRHVSIILHSGLAGRAPIPAPVPPPSECVIYFFQKIVSSGVNVDFKKTKTERKRKSMSCGRSRVSEHMPSRTNSRSPTFRVSLPSFLERQHHNDTQCKSA